MAKSSSDGWKGLLYGVIGGLVTIYGFFMFIRPERYDIALFGKYSSLVGLFMFILGVIFFGYFFEK